MENIHADQDGEYEVNYVWLKLDRTVKDNILKTVA